MHCCTTVKTCVQCPFVCCVSWFQVQGVKCWQCLVWCKHDAFVAQVVKVQPQVQIRVGGEGQVLQCYALASYVCLDSSVQEKGFRM